MASPLEVVGLAVTILGVLAGVGAFLVKYALLPWLKEHLVKPVKQTNHQVTVNAHKSREPTVLDKLDNLSTDQDDLRADVRTLAKVLEAHIEHTQERENRA